MPPFDDDASAPTRARLLEATAVALARYGPRKLNLTDIAQIAGVARQTVYRHFASRDELLSALAVHERERFTTELGDAVRGLTGSARLDRALRFIVEYQRDDPMRPLAAMEPAFMLGQLETALSAMTPALQKLFEQLASENGSASARAADLADLVVRTALSHHLIRGRRGQLLRELRHIAGLPT